MVVECIIDVYRKLKRLTDTHMRWVAIFVCSVFFIPGIPYIEYPIVDSDLTRVVGVVERVGVAYKSSTVLVFVRDNSGYVHRLSTNNYIENNLDGVFEALKSREVVEAFYVSGCLYRDMNFCDKLVRFKVAGKDVFDYVEASEDHKVVIRNFRYFFWGLVVSLLVSFFICFKAYRNIV